MIPHRASGILCHITSLPSPYGVGDFGPQAYLFVDALARAGQSWWQVLPLNPTDNALGNSPYSSFSAFAFNILFLSPDKLVEQGFLEQKDVSRYLSLSHERVDYIHAYPVKETLLTLAYERYCQRKFPLKSFEQFCEINRTWLDDYAFFVVIKRLFANVCWSDWPVEYRDRHPAAMEEMGIRKQYDIQREKFGQFLLCQQWFALQSYCSGKNIGFLGDIPIYVNYDSVDVWVCPAIFKLDPDKRQEFVAGVPPDYFSKIGQRWGNPVYDWDALRATGFRFWIERIRHNFIFFDMVRVDHFRGFAQCWEIPAEEQTAVNGRWRDVPGAELFRTLQDACGTLPIIAEDLGIITSDVDALKEKFSFPGMRVLMFAFHNEYKKSRDIPENHTLQSVVYTGTHDNNTVQGWFADDITAVEKKNIKEYLGSLPLAKDIHWTMMGLAMKSPALLCMIPIQDVLGLGSEARMNTPSVAGGNWSWRFTVEQLEDSLLRRVLAITKDAGR